MDNFNGLIGEQRCFDGKRREMYEILDWQFRIQGKFRPES